MAWQGGEPTLMGLDFFKRSVELVKQYKRPGQQVTYSLQTNGTRLDDAWCAFFKENDFLIGLSVDGPPEMHNAYRVDKGGQGSFDQVKRGWDLLQKHRVDTNILCAVHAANASHPLEVYRFFRDDLAGQVHPVHPDRRAPAARGTRQPRPSAALVSNPLGESRPAFGSFLIEIFDEWVQHDVGTVFVQTFDSALASWCGLPASVCIFQETCGLSLVLEHNGDLYACDHFVEPGHRLGNILETPMIELVIRPASASSGWINATGCPLSAGQCDVRFACQGECPRNRFLRTPEGEEGLNYLCAGYRLFFHHVDAPHAQDGRAVAAGTRTGRDHAEHAIAGCCWCAL